MLLLNFLNLISNFNILLIFSVVLVFFIVLFYRNWWYKKIIESGFWKYIVGIIFIVITMTLGQLPLGICATLKLISEGKPITLDEKNIMTILDKNLTFFLLLLSFLGIIIGLYYVLKFIHNQSLSNLITTRKKIDWKRIFFSFGIWGSFQLISSFVIFELYPEDFVWNFKPIPFLILAIISIFMIPIQTSAEELFFRGYLMQGFGLLAQNKWFPLLSSSILFGLLHYANPEVDKMGNIIMVYYIGTGLFLGVLTLMDDGLELALGFHAANNLVTALLVTADWTAFQTNSILKDISDPKTGIEIFLPILIIYPLLILLFAKKYKWNNWKEKLLVKFTNNNLNHPSNHE